MPQRPLSTQQKRQDKRKKLMLEALAKHGCFVSEATKAAGINRATHYRWLDSDSDYAEAVEDVRYRLDDKIESVLYRTALGLDTGTPNPMLLKWLSATRLKHRGYVEKTEQNTKHSGGVSVRLVNYGERF